MMIRQILSWGLYAVVVLLPAAGFAADVPDGIYRVLPDQAEGTKLVDGGSEGTRIARTVGGEIRLGTRLSDRFGEVTMWSLSNQNDLFRVTMKGAGPLDPTGRLAIVVSGDCEMVSSNTEPDQAGKTDLIADIHGYANAEKVAASLKISLVRGIRG